MILLSDQADSVVGLHALSRRAGIPPHALLSTLGAAIPRVYLADATSCGAGTTPIRIAEASSGTASMAAG